MTPRALIYLGAASFLLGGAFLYVKKLEQEQNPPSRQISTSATEVAPESRITVAIRNGSLEGEPVQLQTTVGQPVGLRVLIDQDDEIHLHGIDLTFKLSANQPNLLNLVANQPGAFDLELHGLPITIGVLEVYPE